MTKDQEILGRILKSRIEREMTNGTLEKDKDNLNKTLNIFLGGDAITLDQYSEFTELITPVATTTAAQ